MNKRIILLSGPPQVGKSEAVKHIQKLFNNAFEEVPCKKFLHEDTMKLFAVPEDVYWRLYTNELKDKPCSAYQLNTYQAESLIPHLEGVNSLDLFQQRLEDLYYITPRQAMIYTSEVGRKPLYGDDYYGKKRAEWIENSYSTLFIDDSAGFSEELPPTFDAVGKENVFLLEIEREGYTREGDSRKPLDHGLFLKENIIKVFNLAELSSYEQRTDIIHEAGTNCAISDGTLDNYLECIENCLEFWDFDYE